MRAKTGMPLMDLPLDWQGELLVEQSSHQTWRIISPDTPQLHLIGCQVTELTNLGFWCEHRGAMWLLQQHQGQYWLTRLVRAKTQPSPSDWRGLPLQELASEGQQITIHLSKQHPQQLFQFAQFRYQSRKPRLLELSHGRFYLSLQLPTEDLFLYQQGSQTLVVSAGTVGAGKF
ncbi:hypothetical protein [Pseudidiomarina terrestris]|uniref:DUF4178 domain-containing protein n=1 Tax=Pseudidiomarina terrestris TaxID=2820060 RepID=A0AAW7R3I0_9GAMM|nr:MULTISPECIES: hypothetical protein [unclassified Pseudidiomarina]MDN7125703.1 hypothetical protein [Pseudidiomarina sp. 1APP75-32.1]MDN7128147.1 hypothetical protein [Pseudidiomarina sp. 1APR75-33.1]MDN7130655.1 hypothetical protein [Pseudidiomarina sp. 1APR75-15]MDN7136570.1 hypothetical protein [Pseudidiomarina sp. 1ASP75-5]MDN7138916.1 hypothetical protein [Pseudidiomarina sp. 1ASP75-14]